MLFHGPEKSEKHINWLTSLTEAIIDSVEREVVRDIINRLLAFIKIHPRQNIFEDPKLPIVKLELKQQNRTRSKNEPLTLQLKDRNVRFQNFQEKNNLKFPDYDKFTWAKKENMIVEANKIC